MAASGPLIAAKTLNRVEVDRSGSNQHEFHAGTLRRMLGFGEDKVSGKLTVLALLEDGTEPLTAEGTFTLYDARLRIPGRSEWRLYYSGDAIQRYARQGDLLILYRDSDTHRDLHAVLVRAGTKHEATLRSALALGDAGTIGRFVRGRAQRATRPDLIEEQALAWASGLVFDVANHPLARRAAMAGEMPTTSEMADAATEIVIGRFGHTLGPDHFLLSSLDAESQLFYALEEATAHGEIEELFERSPRLTDLLNFAQSKLQARKSRRGRSLENHVRKVLFEYGIPFTAQCVTEPGSRPDFVIPGCEAYHDPDFPAQRLRMVGCKSRIRERWRQYLKEASRIPVKYHVTVDENLTEDTLRDMHGNNLRVFMPKPLIERAYSGNACAELIGTIEELINELRAVTVGVQAPRNRC